MRVLSRMFAYGSHVLSSAGKPRHSTRNWRFLPTPRVSKIRAASWTGPAGCLLSGFLGFFGWQAAFCTNWEISLWPSDDRKLWLSFGLRTCEKETKDAHVNFKSLTTIYIYSNLCFVLLNLISSEAKAVVLKAIFRVTWARSSRPRSLFLSASILIFRMS